MDLDREDERQPVDLLAEEFSRRLRRGERVSIDEYAHRHPELAEDIRARFVEVQSVEEGNDRTFSGVDSGGGLASVRAPRRLGDYRIIREIGRGGMGIVYEAEQTSLKRRVAVKVISRASLLNDAQLRRFELEARAAANLHHTNIVPVFGVGENDGLRYYVMQYIRGRSLDEVLNEERGGGVADGTTLHLASAPSQRDPVEEALAPLRGRDASDDPAYGRAALPMGSRWRAIARIGAQVADALDYAHTQGVLHRDIKPANLLVDEANTVWVTDFGLAKLDEVEATDATERVTKTGDVIGTLRYLAPERFQGRGDARADIYSLGLTLYELVTLRAPFEDTIPAKLIRKVTQGRPTAPRKVNPSIPRDLETIILKATAPNPDHRYGNAAELRDDLQSFYEDRPIEARRTFLVERVWRWGRRNPVVAALSVASIVLLALVAVVATVGYLRTDRALGEAFREKQKAQATLRLALDAFEEIFSQVNSAGLSVGSDWSGEIGEESEAAEESEESEDGDPSFPPAVSPEFVAILQRLLSFYERFAETNTDDPGLQLHMARAHHRVGDIQHRLGNFDLAEAAYRRGLEVHDGLVRAGDDPTRRWLERVRIRNSFGLLLAATERRDEARDAHREALMVLEALPDDVRGEATARFESARTHAYLAQTRGFADRRGRDGGASSGEHRREALATLQSLVAEKPFEPEYRATLARVYRDQRFRRRREAAESSVDFRAEALKMFDALRRDYPSNPDYLHELALTYAEQDRWRGRREDAAARPGTENLEEAVRLGRQLVRQYPGVPRYTLSLVRHELRLVERLVGDPGPADRSRLETAGERVNAAMEHVDPLFERAPSTPSYAYYRGKAKLYSGIIQVRRGEPTPARAIFAEAAQQLERSLEANRDRRNVGLYLAIVEEWSALLRKLGETAEAAARETAAESWRQALGGRRAFPRFRFPISGDPRRSPELRARMGSDTRSRRDFR